jgi:hypothetical protein
MFLPGILTDVEMKRPAIDLDDELVGQPAQVCLLARDADVQPRKWPVGVS